MMILTDKKPRVNVEAILTTQEIHDIEHYIDIILIHVQPRWMP